MDTKNKIKNDLKAKKGNNRYIPSLITSVRIIFLPLFLYLYFIDLKFISFIVFLFLSLTDLLDGYIARRMGVCSTKGAYFDTSADFILILAAFTAFVIKGIYPYWILFLIIFMFLQFILTSKIKIPVYDPVGKYFGTILFGGALITLIFQNTLLYSLITLFILLFAVISLLSRYIFLFLRWRRLKKF
jgi:phosphatidylglycerophosphate synthase